MSAVVNLLKLTNCLHLVPGTGISIRAEALMYWAALKAAFTRFHRRSLRTDVLAHCCPFDSDISSNLLTFWCRGQESNLHTLSGTRS